ncbi:MAG: aminotransferase class V-fold PLP-dependent enzyme [Chloroflexi bacterium]|nr:aminotransferase class V-fold PLP-dependent enzyme [Chloroflexota bacterium]
MAKSSIGSLQDLFLLDPNIIFLNHGSFGACPRSVFEVYQAWQRELELQPVEFLGRQAPKLLAHARKCLANYLGVLADEIVYFTNPTTAINMVARSIGLKPGDEILATDHEYGAMDRIWRFICRQAGATYIRQPIPLPVTTQEDFVDNLFRDVNERTRAIFISHITSSTALIFPVEEICKRARRQGILSIVDGAHAPGQIPLDLKAVEADIYTGACHKWLMAPKGSAFLYARPEVQSWLMPLVVSWGYESDYPSDSQFIDYHEWQGTRDFAAFLTVPAAIEFQFQHDWANVRHDCHILACDTRQKINAITGLEPVCPDDEQSRDARPWFNQMFTAQLPAKVDLDQFKKRLYDEYRIEAPVISWNGLKLIRISIQGYNSQSDVDALIEALPRLL